MSNYDENYTAGVVSNDYPLCSIKLEEGATLPTRAHTSDVGYDVTAMRVEYVYEELPWWKKLFGIKPRLLSVKCDTGVAVAPESSDWWWMAVPNSRISKMPFILGNSCGIIDPDYRGTIRFIYNVLPYGKDTDSEVLEFFGQKNRVIGQLIPMKRHSFNIKEVAVVNNTERGSGGFGSTENK